MSCTIAGAKQVKLKVLPLPKLLEKAQKKTGIFASRERNHGKIQTLDDYQTQEMKDTFFPINYFKSSTKLLKKFLFIKILYISKMILRLKNAEGMIIQIS